MVVCPDFSTLPLAFQAQTVFPAAYARPVTLCLGRCLNNKFNTISLFYSVQTAVGRCNCNTLPNLRSRSVTRLPFQLHLRFVLPWPSTGLYALRVFRRQFQVSKVCFFLLKNKFMIIAVGQPLRPPAPSLPGPLRL